MLFLFFTASSVTVLKCNILHLCFREDGDEIHHPLNKAGVLKHVQDMIETLSKINGKLSRVFDYHEAMGINLKSEDQNIITTSKKNVKNPLEFVPLRSVYTSLFSTGLHLQNSLLKVRQLEKIFDLMEKRKSEYQHNEKNDDEIGSPVALPGGPSQAEIVQWLKGFEEIQGELNACVGCLEDGVSNIDHLQNKKRDMPKDLSPSTEKSESSHIVRNGQQDGPSIVPIVDNDDPTQHLDEVFEAVIENDTTDDESLSKSKMEKYIMDEEYRRKIKSEKRLMQELRSVLVEKQAEHEKREAIALARQNGTIENCEDYKKLDNDNHYMASHTISQNLLTNSSHADVLDKNANTNRISPLSENGELNNEYCELVIDCNATCTNNDEVSQAHSDAFKNLDPFAFSRDKSLRSKNKNSSFQDNCFEDSFVPLTEKQIPLGNIANDSHIDTASVLESYLQDSLKEAANVNNESLSIELSYTDDVQRATVSSNGLYPINDTPNYCQSERKYIHHIFEKKHCDQSGIGNNAANLLVNEQENYKDNKSAKRRSRDLPPLNIEKNYLADESDSASDSESSDQGTVKLKGTVNKQPSESSNSDKEPYNQILSTKAHQIPRSISGQVLTDEENDEYSNVDQIEANGYEEISANENIKEQKDSDSCHDSSSSSSYCDDSSDESDIDSKAHEGCAKPIPLKTVDFSSQEKQKSGRIDLKCTTMTFTSPFESSVTNSISSSEASSFVYNENPAPSYSSNTKAQISCSALPVSMTSSFYSTFCSTNKQERSDQTNCSLAEIRSVSTPDLKRLAITSSTSSPYISLDDLTPKADENDGYENSSSEESSCYSDTLNDSYLNSIGEDIVDEGSIHSSTEWGSADELNHHVLKTYRRPLRPAANTTPTKSMESASLEQDEITRVEQDKSAIESITISSCSDKRKSKRNRNRSIIVSENKFDKNENAKHGDQIFKTEAPTCTIPGDKYYNGKEKNYADNRVDCNTKENDSILNTSHTSVYINRKRKETGGPLKISLPRNPLGFDSILASQVAQKAKTFTAGLSSKGKNEEVFGDSDSE